MFYVILGIIAFPFLVFCSYIVLLQFTNISGVMRKQFDRDPGSMKNLTVPTVNYSIMIVTRGIKESLLIKLESIAKLHSHNQISNVVIGLDGASVADLASNYKSRLNKIESKLSIEYVESENHIGKNAVINKMLPYAKGAVLLFTDVDAIIGENSLSILNQWFADKNVGAVVGLRVIADHSDFGSAQSSYVDFDTKIKNWEMRFLGSVTSCDGKLYAIRSNLVDNIPLHVTDDTFIGLGAPVQHKRLVFDATLTAVIGRPAKTPMHEFDRRRRVTSRGLHSLFERKRLFMIPQYGWYSYCLFSNKVCRRFAPASLLFFLLASTFALGLRLGLLSTLIIILLFVLSFGFHSRETSPEGTSNKQNKGTIVTRLISAASYILLGMSAMTLGLIDFLRGKKFSKWEPKKS